MNKNLKTFITIFCYIGAIAGFVTVFTASNHKPAQTSTAILAGVIGVVLLVAAIALTRKPRY